ncbi:uncharacterized protein LOC135840167 isoform X2 [Planococcus citri]|uniref:uncharacterized protein LOC135840167 isoform X2 n=1 Tax=Planococcus citri TaxID=170843 RepID=UPI0031F90D26
MSGIAAIAKALKWCLLFCSSDGGTVHIHSDSERFHLDMDSKDTQPANLKNTKVNTSSSNLSSQKDSPNAEKINDNSKKQSGQVDETECQNNVLDQLLEKMRTGEAFNRRSRTSRNSSFELLRPSRRPPLNSPKAMLKSYVTTTPLSPNSTPSKGQSTTTSSSNQPSELFLDTRTPKTVAEILVDTITPKPYTPPNDTRSPILFIEQFEVCVELLNLNDKQKTALFARMAFVDETVSYEIMRKKSITYDQAKDYFLKMTWSNRKQKEVIEQLRKCDHVDGDVEKYVKIWFDRIKGMESDLLREAFAILKSRMSYPYYEFVLELEKTMELSQFLIQCSTFEDPIRSSVQK